MYQIYSISQFVAHRCDPRSVIMNRSNDRIIDPISSQSWHFLRPGMWIFHLRAHMTNTFVLSVMITVIMSSIVSLFMMLSNGAIGCERKSSISYTSCCFPPLSLFYLFLFLWIVKVLEFKESPPIDFLRCLNLLSIVRVEILRLPDAIQSIYRAISEQFPSSLLLVTLRTIVLFRNDSIV